MTLSLRPSINWLLVFIPLSLALEAAEVPAPLLFFAAALAAFAFGVIDTDER